MGNALLQVTNFGPVKRGRFEIRPLTVFLGQNNTGKTYCALLVYSIYQAILGRISGTIPSLPSHLYSTTSERRFARDWRQIASILESTPEAHLSDFPDFTRQHLTEVLQESLSRFPQVMEIALNKYFPYGRPDELICTNLQNPRSMTVDLKHPDDTSYLKLKIAPRGKKIHLSTSLSVDDYTLKRSHVQHLLKLRAPSTYIVYDLLSSCFQELFHGFDRRAVYYLPAGRSGTLQVWPLMGTAITESLSRVLGLHPINLGTVPGITSDFMKTIFDLIGAFRPSGKSALDEVIRFMETEILQGEVGLSRTGDLRTPNFLYRTPRLRIDLSRSSSMIAELAPLDMLMKTLLARPRSLLIIDEPEAHLHPENQRRVALLIASLVRHGVNVICTTHSHIFLHQISNLVLASKLSAERRNELNLLSSTLEESDVGVYLFDKQASLVSIRETPLMEAAGYAEDEYVKVYEELLEEYHKLAH